MAKRTRNRTSVLRVAGAAFVAIVFWLLVSLSDTFVRTVEVPLRVELPTNQALVQPVPPAIHLTVRASGWSLLKMVTIGQTYCLLTPATHVADSPRTFRVTNTEILANIRTNVAEAQQLAVSPASLQLVIGPVASKQVPLLPDVTINPRKGFDAIGAVEVTPDSITLRGSSDALRTIDGWRTRHVVLNDVHEPIRMLVRVSDSLRGVVTPAQGVAVIATDVQEIAERSFTDVPLINRGIERDTSLHLVLQPDRIEVMVRGGVESLSRLNPASLSAYVDIDYGVDTTGVTLPTIVLPPGFTAVRVDPPRIRYYWQHVVRRTGAQ